MLQLQPVCGEEREKPKDVANANDQTDESPNIEEKAGDTTDEDTEDSSTDEDELDEATPPLEEADACELATWEALSIMLGFRHSFDPSHCPYVLYSALTPLLWDGQQMTSTASHVKPFLKKISASAVVESAADVWPGVCEASGFWLNDIFIPLEQCVWEAGGSESLVWHALLAVGCRTGPVLALEPVLRDLLGQSSALADLKKCCISGALPLPYATDLDMMFNSVLPWLLELDGVTAAGHEPAAQQEAQQSWSENLQLCYSAVVDTIASGKFPRSKRWKLPVPSANLSPCQIVVDAAFNRLLTREADTLVVLPDSVNWPASTDLLLAHSGSQCLHPSLASVFSQIADRQSVSLESPRMRIQRTLKSCLRLVAADEGGTDNDMWNLISEVQGRSAAASSTPAEVVDSDWTTRCSDADNWDLLLWAAISCATQWHRMQTTGTPQDAARYQETLSRTRRVVPFITEGTYADGDNERWSFILNNRSANSRPDPVLLLRTLFGFNLWGNLDGLELRGQPPSCTADLPTGVIFSCATCQNPDGHFLFPEHFDRPSLILVWEWFLLEVVGAAPPAVLWASFQEPVAAWARPRIRAAEAAMREPIAHLNSSQVGGDDTSKSLEESLLESVIAHTQVDILFHEMDAADEARRAAAAQEAEARRREREAAQVRRTQEREQEREDRRSEQAQARQRRQAAAADMRQQQQQEETSHHQQPQQAAHQTLIQHSNRIQRMVANVNDTETYRPQAPVQQHRQAPQMRESQVRGKLVRFLAGMRAYERQLASGTSPDQSLPPVLSDFIAWSGNFLEAGNSSGGGNSRHKNQTGIDAAACKYVGRDGSSNRADKGKEVGAAGERSQSSEECCPICLEDIGDASVFDTLGEPVWTACGHCFHAVCFARHMESSMQDPWCPVCRGTDMTVRFSAGRNK